MNICIFNKNMALLASTELESSVVPRVGEIIFLEHGFENMPTDTEFTVTEVSYLLSNGKLIPSIHCQAGSGVENRRMLLQEQGWL
jgi:hypothetical protein